MKAFIVFVPLFVLGACALGAENQTRETPLAAPEVFTGYDDESFRKLDAAKEKLPEDNINFDLLSAAVFHETNRRREMEGLPALRHDAKVRDVARMQAKIMEERGSISHVNPKLTKKETPTDRFHAAGLKPAFSAENVATAFGLKYEEGQPFYTREEGGKKVFSREPGGEPIERHSYITFAEALLDSWMNSPGHRKNIVSTEPEYLGASSRPGVNKLGMPLFYCAQAFYTPLNVSAPQ